MWKEIQSLRKGQEKLWEEIKDIRITLNIVALTKDRLKVSVEKKFLSPIKHRLEERLGVEIELNRLFMDIREVEIYVWLEKQP